MRNVIMRYWTCVVAVVFAFAFCVKAESPVAVLNAMQLPIEDLDLDSELENILSDEIAVSEPAAEPVAEAVEEFDVADMIDKSADEEPVAAEEAPAAVEDVVADVAEVVEEEPVAVEEVAVEEAPAAVEDVVADVAEVIEEEPAAVEEIAVEEAPAAVEEVVADVAEVIEEAPAAVEEVAVEEAPVAVEAPESISVEDLSLADLLDMDEPAVAEEAPAVVEEVVADVAEESPIVVEEPAVAEEAPAETGLDLEGLLDSTPAVVEEVAVEETPAAVEEVVAEETTSVAAEPNPDAALISEMEAISDVLHLAQDKHGVGALNQAQREMEHGNYENAAKEFQNALDYIAERPNTVHYRNQAKTGLMEAYYQQAQLLKSRGEYELAKKAANDARIKGHPMADSLVAELTNLIENPPLPPPTPRNIRPNQPEYKANVQKIKDGITRAREYYSTGEYDLCRHELELIMRDNPYNTEAISMLKKLEDRRLDVAASESEATRRKMIYDVKSIWTPSSYAIEAPDLATAGSGGPIATSAPDAVKIQEKMKKIVIPEISFRQANLVDVITFLGEMSREHDDANEDPDKRGINIVLTLAGGNVPAAAPVQNLDDPFAAPMVDVAAPVGGPAPITFQARYVTLFDALGIVMNLADLKYQIKGTVVMVMPRNTPDSELIHRMYNVLPTIAERLVTFKDERKGSGDSSDPFQMETATIDRQNDWKTFFGDLGVSWPDGSSIQHMPSINKLVVKNTADNLATLETVLQELNVTPRQVEIEARFVEVMQTDLESLGFEWILNNDWELLENKNDSALPLDGRRRIQAEGGNITRGFSYLSSDGLYGVQDAVAIPDNLLTIKSVLTNPEVSMVLHMISRCQNTDLLSAPKVVAKNGAEAVIKVVKEYIYPTEYSVETVDSGDGDDNTVQINDMMPYVVIPETFERREVGVILQVVPDVSEDGQLINLTMAPQVVDDPEWFDYGYDVDANGQMHLPMRQPFFPVRSIATSIQVYNGATVVMGGMITEERIASKDKIPILGDIPLIGRLFRYEYENSQKRNLLIFVTAKLVDPAGRVVRDGTNKQVAIAGGPSIATSAK